MKLWRKTNLTMQITIKIVNFNYDFATINYRN